MKLRGKSKRMAGVWIFALLAVVAGVVGVANADPTLTEILDTLYGSGNFTEVTGDYDQVWENPDPPGAVPVLAQAKWAASDQELGFLPGETGDTFVSLFEVSGDGYLGGSPSATLLAADTGEFFRFADKIPGGFFSPSKTWSSLPSDNPAAWTI